MGRLFSNLFAGKTERRECNAMQNGDFVERRRFPRYAVKGGPFHVTLVLKGASLIQKTSFNAFEMDARPINISRSGLCVSLDLNSDWETFSPNHEIEISLKKPGFLQQIKSKIVYLNKAKNLIAFEFTKPLSDVYSLMVGQPA